MFESFQSVCANTTYACAAGVGAVVVAYGAARGMKFLSGSVKCVTAVSFVGSLIIDGMGDYLGRVDSVSKPTVWPYNQVNDETGMGAVATWRGLPLRMAKISNFLVGYTTKRIGVWSVSRGLSQGIGTHNDESASMSWDAGVAVADGADFDSTTGSMVTNAWKVSDQKERRLWPNPSPADNHTTRSLIRDFNLNFISPGFTERIP